MSALLNPRRSRPHTGQVLIQWALLILCSWACLAGVAFVVYFTLNTVWP